MVGAGLGEREFCCQRWCSALEKSWCAVIRIQVSTTCRGKFSKHQKISLLLQFQTHITKLFTLISCPPTEATMSHSKFHDRINMQI